MAQRVYLGFHKYTGEAQGLCRQRVKAFHTSCKWGCRLTHKFLDRTCSPPSLAFLKEVLNSRRNFFLLSLPSLFKGGVGFQEKLLSSLPPSPFKGGVEFQEGETSFFPPSLPRLSKWGVEFQEKLVSHQCQQQGSSQAPSRGLTVSRVHQVFPKGGRVARRSCSQPALA